MKKPTVLLASAVVIALIAVILFNGSRLTEVPNDPGDTSGTPTSTPNLLPAITIGKLPEPKLRLPTARTSPAWEVFQKYLVAAKNNDLETVKSLSYKLSDVCLDPNKREDCNRRMTFVYELAKDLKEEDFTNSWGDNKQIIISTSYQKVEDKEVEVTGFKRSIVYFVLSDGGPKILAFNDEDAVYALNDGRGPEEVESYLLSLIKDADEDATPDIIEQCTDGPSWCVQSDPKKRDTDSDGWWDSTELYVK